MSGHSSLVRGTVVVGLALLVLAGLPRIGGWLAGSDKAWMGLDVLEVWREHGRSVERLARTEQRLAEAQVVAVQCDALLHEVLECRLSVSEGLDELRRLAAESPTLQHTLATEFHHLPPDQALLAFYRTRLEEVGPAYPSSIVAIRQQVEALRCG